MVTHVIGSWKDLYVDNTFSPIDSGMTAKRVEWSKVKQGIVLAEGFPSDLQPGPASSFGKENLIKILDSNIVISFRGKRSISLSF